MEDGKEGILTREELLCGVDRIECEVCPLCEGCCIIDEDQEDREEALARTALYWMDEAKQAREQLNSEVGLYIDSKYRNHRLRSDFDALRDENVSATNSLERKLAALTERVDLHEQRLGFVEAEQVSPAEPSHERPTGNESLDITNWCPNCKHRFSYAGGVSQCFDCGISMRPVGPPSGFEAAELKPITVRRCGACGDCEVVESDLSLWCKHHRMTIHGGDVLRCWRPRDGEGG